MKIGTDNFAALNLVPGGVCAPAGIVAGGCKAGFYKGKDRLDLALVVAEGEAPVAAGVFTQNIFCAAPVQVSQRHVADGHARAVVLNAGCANAATGEPGIEAAIQTAQLVAAELGCQPAEVLVASTGVIGHPLPMEPFAEHLPSLVAKLSKEGADAAAHAIMTTDTHDKQVAAEFKIAGQTYKIGGMCKGSGMISPNMATMLGVLTTDAPLTPAAAQQALQQATALSFNKVTVDSDTSTNDSVFLLASGAAGGEVITAETQAAAQFTEALSAICVQLARQIAADGEGATKLVTVHVEGAASPEDADAAARTVANSPLVKTAIAGHDCNWGRIAGALGRSGAAFRQEEVDIDIMGMPVLRAGLPCGFDEDEALRRFEAPEIEIRAHLGAGECATTVWTCDFTHDYITINGDYRT